MNDSIDSDGREEDDSDEIEQLNYSQIETNPTFFTPAAAPPAPPLPSVDLIKTTIIPACVWGEEKL